MLAHAEFEAAHYAAPNLEPQSHRTGRGTVTVHEPGDEVRVLPPHADHGPLWTPIGSHPVSMIHPDSLSVNTV